VSLLLDNILYYFYYFFCKMDFVWKITHIGPREEVGPNLLPKLSFIVEELEGQYPNSLVIDLIKEKTDIISSYSVWDEVKVSINFKAREYNGRHFTNISGRRIERVWWSQSSHTPKETKKESRPSDDLPF